MKPQDINTTIKGGEKEERGLVDLGLKLSSFPQA